MSLELRPYQEKLIYDLSYKVSLGNRRLLAQLPTGSGKTFTFAGIVYRYVKRNNKRVLILVHRMELLQQTRKTLYNGYGIIAETLTAGCKHPPKSMVVVGMVETAYNRFKKNENYIANVGMLIVDEVHFGVFRKLYDYFQSSIIIGFTATPVAASKKTPLKNDFDDIVCGIDIPDLIHQNALVPNRTYHVKNINRKSLSIRNGEFDDRMMGNTFSTGKHVQNCIKGYEQHAKGTRTLVFNCNIEHSKIVNEAFLKAGYNSRHIDANSTDREDAVEWFNNTPDAILNNVGILTTGFDAPATRTVIVNKSTMSLPLWLQMTGRGSRPHPGKEYFTIIDMGGNALYHGDWCAQRDWADIFHYPEKPSSGGGVAPVKCCVSCEAIIHASVKVCPHCGAANASEIAYDDIDAEFEMLTESRPLKVDVTATIKAAEGKNPYYAIHQMKHTIIGTAQYQWKVKTMTDGVAYKLLDMFQDKVKEWCKANGKKYNDWHKRTTSEWFFDELKKKYKWEAPTLKMAV